MYVRYRIKRAKDPYLRWIQPMRSNAAVDELSAAAAAIKSAPTLEERCSVLSAAAQHQHRVGLFLRRQ